MTDLILKQDLEKSDEELMIQEFKRLSEIRKFNPDEMDRLEEYCRCRVQAFRMRAMVEQEGEVFISARGGSYMNPRCALLQGVLSRMDKLRDKLFPVDKTQIEETKDIREEFFR